MRVSEQQTANRAPGAVAAKWRALRLLRDVTPLTRLLVLTLLAFNVGFYMVLPFLAVHLTRDVGLAAGMVGAVLGLRMVSQQGLFFLGGLLADRHGTRPVVLAGIALRIAGFGLLGVSLSPVAVLIAVVGIGVAGALFTPAVEGALARDAGRHERAGGPTRTDVFALSSVCGQVGSLAGPAVGSLLLLVDFRVSCLVAAGVFVVALALHLRHLPADRPERAGVPLLHGWGEVFGNRPFVLFVLAFSGYLATYNQLYLALPLELSRTVGGEAAVGWLFSAAAVLVIAGQLPVSAWAAGRLSVPVTLVAGFALMAAGALAVAVARQLAATPSRGALLLAAGTFVLLLTAGQMLLLPASRDAVARLARERRLATHFGVLSSAGGLAVLLSSGIVGWAFDVSDPAGPARALPWLCVAAFPVLSAVALALLARDLHPHDTQEDT